MFSLDEKLCRNQRQLFYLKIASRLCNFVFEFNELTNLSCTILIILINSFAYNTNF